MTLRIALIAPLALLVTACGDDTSEPAPSEDDSSRGATGEILGGTVSDEMIAYEDVQSSAPTLNDAPNAGDEAGE